MAMHTPGEANSSSQVMGLTRVTYDTITVQSENEGRVERV